MSPIRVCLSELHERPTYEGAQIVTGPQKFVYTPPPPPMKYWLARLWGETKEKCRFVRKKTENKSPVENYNANLLQQGRRYRQVLFWNDGK